MFKPVSGLFGLFEESKIKENDILKRINQKLLDNPQAVVILTNIFHKPLLFFISPEYIKEMYLNHQDYSKFDPLNMQRLSNRGLSMSEGKEWKRQRKLLSNSFTFEKLISRLPMINQVVNMMCENDEKNDISSFLSKITGEVVIQSFFGDLAEGLMFEGQPAQVSTANLITDLFQSSFSNPYILIKQLILKEKSWRFFPIQKEKQLMERTENFILLIQQLIKKRITQLEGKPIDKDDKDIFLLDLYVIEYLKNKNKSDKIDFDEVVHQFITFFVAGTETTATTCGTGLYFLAKYPQIQEELFQEIHQTVGNKDILETDIVKLICVNAFIQEVLRLRNPAFGPVIRVVKQDKQIHEIKLKKGWYALQYHNASSIQENYFDQANQFNYKRWIDQKEVIKNDNGYIHIPFAAGPRNCIGQHMALMETKIILSILIRKYQIELNPEIKQIRFGLKLLQCVQPDNCILFKQRK